MLLPQPVVVAGVDRQLDSLLWTPAGFERDFGDELADLVDCRMGLVLLQVPCRTFWAGFDNMSGELIALGGNCMCMRCCVPVSIWAYVCLYTACFIYSVNL